MGIDRCLLRCGGLWLALVLGGCAAVPSPPTEEQEGVLLEYLVVEQGHEQGRLRLLITPDWLRVDNGVGGDGYWVVDRRQQRVYGVGIEEEAQPPRRLPEAPAPITWSLARSPSLALTQGRGGRAEHLRWRREGVDCLEAVVLPEAAPWVRSALMEVRLLQPSVPWEQDLPASCGEALEADPLAPFREGVPLRLWNGGGNGWFLQDHRQGVRLPPVVFSLEKQ